MGLTRELLQGITSVRRAANRDPVRERVTPARLRGQKELQMKRLTLVCFLLSFCATSIVAGPAPQSNCQTSGESKCSAGFKECQESLIDFRAAEQFMQLKATVLADLNRLEKSRPTKPKIAPVRVAFVNRQKTGNGAVYRATVGLNRKSSVQTTSAVQPVSLESAAGTPSYKRMP